MNVFKQLIVSLYSPKDISTFHHQKIGKTFLYVLILTLCPFYQVYTTLILLWLMEWIRSKKSSKGTSSLYN